MSSSPAWDASLPLVVSYMDWSSQVCTTSQSPCPITSESINTSRRMTSLARYNFENTCEHRSLCLEHPYNFSSQIRHVHCIQVAANWRLRRFVTVILRDPLLLCGWLCLGVGGVTCKLSLVQLSVFQFLMLAGSEKSNLPHCQRQGHVNHQCSTGSDYVSVWTNPQVCAPPIFCRYRQYAGFQVSCYR